MTYQKATVQSRSGKANLYACVTIPQPLRPFFSNSRQRYKSLGTADTREAYEKLRDKEAEIWLEFDRAKITQRKDKNMVTKELEMQANGIRKILDIHSDLRNIDKSLEEIWRECNFVIQNSGECNFTISEPQRYHLSEAMDHIDALRNMNNEV